MQAVARSRHRHGGDRELAGVVPWIRRRGLGQAASILFDAPQPTNYLRKKFEKNGDIELDLRPDPHQLVAELGTAPV